MTLHCHDTLTSYMYITNILISSATSFFNWLWWVTTTHIRLELLLMIFPAPDTPVLPPSRSHGRGLISGLLYEAGRPNKPPPPGHYHPRFHTFQKYPPLDALFSGPWILFSLLLSLHCSFPLLEDCSPILTPLFLWVAYFPPPIWHAWFPPPSYNSLHPPAS